MFEPKQFGPQPSNVSKLAKNQRDYQNLLLIVREHREWLADNYPRLVSGAQQPAVAGKA